MSPRRSHLHDGLYAGPRCAHHWSAVGKEKELCGKTCTTTSAPFSTIGEAAAGATVGEVGGGHHLLRRTGAAGDGHRRGEAGVPSHRHAQFIEFRRHAQPSTSNVGGCYRVLTLISPTDLSENPVSDVPGCRVTGQCLSCSKLNTLEHERQTEDQRVRAKLVVGAGAHNR